jgi:hypothetical protein
VILGLEGVAHAADRPKNQPHKKKLEISTFYSIKTRTGVFDGIHDNSIFSEWCGLIVEGWIKMDEDTGPQSQSSIPETNILGSP